MDIFAKKNHHQKGVQYLILGKERHLFLLFFSCVLLLSVFWYLHGLGYLNL